MTITGLIRLKTDHQLQKKQRPGKRTVYVCVCACVCVIVCVCVYDLPGFPKVNDDLLGFCGVQNQISVRTPLRTSVVCLVVECKSTVVLSSANLAIALGVDGGALMGEEGWKSPVYICVQYEGRGCVVAHSDIQRSVSEEVCNNP